MGEPYRFGRKKTASRARINRPDTSSSRSQCPCIFAPPLCSIPSANTATHTPTMQYLFGTGRTAAAGASGILDVLCRNDSDASEPEDFSLPPNVARKVVCIANGQKFDHDMDDTDSDDAVSTASTIPSRYVQAEWDDALTQIKRDSASQAVVQLERDVCGTPLGPWRRQRQLANSPLDLY